MPGRPDFTMLHNLSDTQLEQIQSALFSGNRIEAIKVYRQAVDTSLTGAVKFINALEEELRASDPTKFTAPPRGKGCGCGTAALCAVILIALVTATTG
jgi:hypothetical protein